MLNTYTTIAAGISLELQDTKRKALSVLIEQNQLNAQNIEEAKSAIEFNPSTSEWKSFIDHLLLWAGVLALSCGLIFFIAANWQDIGRFAKFAIVEGFIIISVLAYLRYQNNPLIANGALFCSMLAVGALMALFGQTYQTGADPWQLFFNWALVVTPWVLVSRFAPIWMLWLALLNVALVLFLTLYYSDTFILNVMWAASLGSLIAWHFAAQKLAFLNKAWAIGLLAVYGTYIATFGAADAIFGAYVSDDTKGLQFVAWLAWLGVIAYLFYMQQRQIFVLACACFSIVFVLNMVVFRLLDNNAYELALFICAGLTIGGGAMSTFWLKKLHEEMKAEETSHA
ncbi:DUF2157 domain-containing protein [Alteromonas sp. W364]|uniref:DUF2157 domain-containing protein n=1 Tax=Alteromonas sp. W364 TaxID=3075610 RepID=UPI00288734C3|nr:DUF2157 domain-containing protein [Alteromonas sp. W364]MDT0629172.1 DUF2157 domain-containing protein [Alteromonas sp. W364]